MNGTDWQNVRQWYFFLSPPPTTTVAETEQVSSSNTWLSKLLTLFIQNIEEPKSCLCYFANRLLQMKNITKVSYCSMSDTVINFKCIKECYSSKTKCLLNLPPQKSVLAWWLIWNFLLISIFKSKWNSLQHNTHKLYCYNKYLHMCSENTGSTKMVLMSDWQSTLLTTAEHNHSSQS